MSQIILVNKCRGLYGKSLIRLKEIERSYNYIPWSFIYLKLCRGFSLTKQEVRELILILRDTGFVDISQRGVKLNFIMKDG